jgi:hypothetical protein
LTRHFYDRSKSTTSVSHNVSEAVGVAIVTAIVGVCEERWPRLVRREALLLFWEPLFTQGGLFDEISRVGSVLVMEA